MKLSKGHRIAMKIIAFIFFALALVGFTHMLNGKFPTFHLLPQSGGTPYKEGSEAGYKAATYVETYMRFYILPFFWAYVGWLLYKGGSEKPELAAPEEKESQKISE